MQVDKIEQDIEELYFPHSVINKKGIKVKYFVLITAVTVHSNMLDGA